MRKARSIVFDLLLVSVLFDSITFYNVGGVFGINIPLILLIIAFLLSFFDTRTRNGKSVLSLVFIAATIGAVGLLSAYPSSITSILLHIMYFGLFFFTKHEDYQAMNLQRPMKGYVIVASLCAVYAVYQFVGYNFIHSLPLQELIPESLLANRFNVHGITYLGGIILQRPHSIYLEASFLSQYSAIGILFCFILRKSLKRRTFFLCLVANAIGLLVSLSGTGLIILGIGFVYMVLTANGAKQKVALIGLAGMGVLVVFLVPDIRDNIIKRLSELNFSRTGYSSGYYRFVLPVFMSYDTLTTPSLFFGYGLGNGDIALELYHAKESILSNGYGKACVEGGLFGIIALIAFLWAIHPKKRAPKNVKMLFVILLCLIAVGTQYANTNFWIFAFYIYADKCRAKALAAQPTPVKTLSRVEIPTEIKRV